MDSKTDIKEKKAKISEKKEKKELKKKKSFIYESIETLVIAFVMAMILRTFVVQAFYIPSSSMENTLLINDMLLANKVIFHFKIPERHEIVIFKNIEEDAKETGKEYIIKRVIGLPGEKICIKKGHVYINGKKLEEPYIKELCNEDYISDIKVEVPIFGKPYLSGNKNEITIPENTFFVMGDNRNNSRDSRYFGFLPLDRIIGRAMVRYWPLNRIGPI